MFKTRSKVLCVTAVLSTLYAIYLMVYIMGAGAGSDTAEQIGTAIGIAIMMPHLILMGLGAIFTCVGFGLAKSWGALVGAILFSVGLLLMPLYFMFTVPLIVLGFVGFSNQKKSKNH